MLRTRRPLQEKMTLFRHGHLTSGLRKVNDPNVHSTQNRFLRQGVGYPNPNRSHFRSMDIWQTAVPDRVEKTGWLGRYLGPTSPRARACRRGSAFPSRRLARHAAEK